MLRSEVLIARFDPSLYSLEIASAFDSTPPRTDIRTLTEKNGGVAGINAGFFDLGGKPLGLLIVDSKEQQRIHQGGSLLTNIFFRGADGYRMTHRTQFSPQGVSLAFQSGPRLTMNGKPVQINSTGVATRRSGIALTKSGNVLLYATALRFPGATFEEIQRMLAHPDLEVADALSLDGGGSSQMYLNKKSGLEEEILVTGGDLIPVGIIVKKIAH